MTFGKIGARKMMYHGILPPGARWVEYLESTGTQWIDTGISTNSSLSFRIALQRTNTNPIDQVALGGRGSDISQYDISLWTNPVLYDKGFAAHYNGNDGTLSRDSSWVYRQNIIANFNEVEVTPIDIKVNGTVCYYWVGSANYNSPYSLYLFALNVSNTGVDERSFIGKIALCDMRIGEAVVRRFRPIAIGNTGYMLDLLTGEYEQYGNKGTGEFVIGPTIAYPERERERESKQLFGLIFHFDNYSTNNIFESDFALSYLKEAA